MKILLVKGLNSRLGFLNNIVNKSNILVKYHVKENYDFLLSRKKVEFVEKPTFVYKNEENIDIFFNLITEINIKTKTAFMHEFNREEFHAYFKNISIYYSDYRYYGEGWYVEVHPVKYVKNFSITFRQVKIYFYIKSDLYDEFIFKFTKAHLRGGG